MNKSKLDRKQWLSDQLAKSFNKEKNDWNSPNALFLHTIRVKNYNYCLFYRGNLFHL
jgi:hypothetical protein